MIGLAMRENIRNIEMFPTSGIYTLVLFLSRGVCLNVGRLGLQRFPRGYYTYTGSALGKGASNLKQRVSRHLRKKKRNFWHIDFVLADENVTLTTVVAAQTHKKLECTLNRLIKMEGGARIVAKRFGAADCIENCGSHLLFFGEENIESKVVALYSRRFGSKYFVMNLS